MIQSAVSGIRLSAPVFLVALLLVACAAPGGFQTGRADYAADGVSGGAVIAPKGVPRDAVIITDPQGALRISAVTDTQDGLRFQFQSTGRAGDVVWSAVGYQPLTLRFLPAGGDSDGDGYDDVLELGASDARALRGWMVRIAESQFLKVSPQWTPEQQDCAGLVRLVYREALKRHDGAWRRSFGFVLDYHAPDVVSYNYPDIPGIGTALFITGKHEDGSWRYGAFADAATLLSWNMVPVGRRIDAAEPGDVVFFENMSNPRWPYHVMLYGGRDETGPLLIYHTGERGMVKRVSAGYLKGSGRFALDDANRHYLGIYRFKILE